MPQETNIRIPHTQIQDSRLIRRQAARQLGIRADQVDQVEILRRSIDARKAPVHYQLRLRVWADEPYIRPADEAPIWPNVAHKPPVHIVGLGPAGLFAALQLIQAGYKPVILERGKAVRDRRRDLAKLTREGVVDPDSNYCFGEGGAGTFSDGKLYTRSTKRGDTRRILQLLVHFGATPDILVDAHPHIGTNKLPRIIQSIREHIIACGGEIHFETRVTGFEVKANRLSLVKTQKGDIPVQALILATGHSARDIFEQLHRAGITIEAKPFALGVRVEHPQPLIDKIQYHLPGARPETLPAASYSLVAQVSDRGVYSFCMCPGGIICPAATATNEVVVNGWSPSKRNSPYANSGMVVEAGPDLWGGQAGDPLRGLRFQAKIEQAAFQAGGGKQVAPAQRLTDFIAGKASTQVPDSSYLPGLAATQLGEVLPPKIFKALQGGFRQFGKKLKGYLTEEAVVVGTESRTSSPVRIPRDRETRMHPQVSGLFPCGEGAGYAGGIMSAAIDGQACALAAVRHLTNQGVKP